MYRIIVWCGELVGTCCNLCLAVAMEAHNENDNIIVIPRSLPQNALQLRLLSTVLDNYLAWIASTGIMSLRPLMFTSIIRV